MSIGAATAGKGIYALAWQPELLEATDPSGSPVYITIDQLLALQPDPQRPREVKFRTLEYYYGISDGPDDDPFLAWHWAPDDPTWFYPHVHAPLLDPRARSERLHIPTGSRVSIEQVLGFLIREGIVQPCNSKWEAVLLEGHERFQYAQRSP